MPAQFAHGIGVTGGTVAHYLDLLVDLLLLRRLSPGTATSANAWSSRPRFTFEISGLVHALLGLAKKEELLGHPIVGDSWEGLRYRNTCLALLRRERIELYRPVAGAEMDLVLGVTGRSQLGGRGQAGRGSQAGAWISYRHRRPGTRQEFRRV